MLNVSEFLFPFCLATDANFHAKLIQRFLFGEIENIEANFIHFLMCFNPEEKPLVVTVCI
jgi:hypothetical protein